jgi:hypothetical protein
MTYQIISSGGSFTIDDNTFKTDTTSLTLPGRNRELYGQPIIQNWVNMLQHFAGATSPANPTPGQIWYDSGLQELKLFQTSLSGSPVAVKILLENNPTTNVTLNDIVARNITASGTISVTEPTKLRVPGGGPGQVLSTDGNSNLYWSTVSGGGGGAINGKDGKDGANGISVINATVYTASNTYPNGPVNGTGTYNFQTATLVPPDGSPLSIEWSIEPPITSTRIYGSSTTFVTTQNNPLATVTAGVWGPPFLAYATGRDGTDGTSATSSFNLSAFRRQTGAPGTPQAGTPGNPSGSWNFTTADGTPPNGTPTSEAWSLTPPPETNPSTPLWVSYATATVTGNTGTNTNNLVWSTPVQLAQIGSAGRDGLSLYNYAVYRVGDTKPTAPSGGSYDFGTSSGVAPTGWSTNTDSFAAGSKIWISVAKAQITGTTGIWQGGIGSWSEPVEFTGIPGQNSVVGYLTNENATVAADTNGIVDPAVLATITGQFKVFDGITDVTARSTFSIVGGTQLGITFVLSSTGSYSITTFTQDTAVVKLRAIYNGIAIDKDFTISKSKTGTTGDRGTNALLVSLLSTAQAFTFTGANLPNPTAQTITFTVNLQNIQGMPTISCTLYNSTGGVIGLASLGGTGLTRTLSVAAFGAAQYAVVTASIGGLSDTITIVRLSDGSNGLNGENGVNGQTTVIGVIYAASTTRPTNISATGSYNFATHVLTPPVAPDVTWYSSIQPTWGGLSVWSSQATFISSTPNATVPNFTAWTSPALAFAPGSEGPPGARGPIPLAFVVTLADPRGLSDAALTTSFSAPREVGQLPPIGVGYAPIAGDAAQFYWKNPSAGGADVTIVRQYDGAVWRNIYQEVISGNVVATGSITASQMNTNSLYALNIRSTNATWELGEPNGNANSAGFWLSTTGNARFGDTLSIGNNLVVGNNATIGTGLTIGGLTTNGVLNANVVSSTQLTANSVTTSKIEANAVIATSIAAGAITAGKIDANAVTAGTIAAGAVTAGKIDANAVTAGTIAAGAVTADKLSVSQLSSVSASIGDLVVQGAGGGYGALSMGSANWSDPSSTGGPGMSGSGMRFQRGNDGSFWFTMGSASTNIAYSSWYDRMYLNGDVVFTKNVNFNNITTTALIDDYPQDPDFGGPWLLGTYGARAYASSWIVVNNTEQPQRIMVTANFTVGNTSRNPSNIGTTMQHSPDGSNWYDFFAGEYSTPASLTTGHAFVSSFQPWYGGTTRIRFICYNNSGESTRLSRLFATGTSMLR